MAKSNTEHKMIKYLKPLAFFKEFLNACDELPSPLLVGLYVSNDYVSLAKADKSYLGVHIYGLYPIDKLDDLVEQLQTLQDNVNYKLGGIIVASNNSAELDLDGKSIIGSSNNSVRADLSGITFRKKVDLSGITFPIQHSQSLCYRARCPRPGDFEVSSVLRMLWGGLDFLNALVDRKNLEGPL